MSTLCINYQSFGRFGNHFIEHYLDDKHLLYRWLPSVTDVLNLAVSYHTTCHSRSNVSSGGSNTVLIDTSLNNIFFVLLVKVSTSTGSMASREDSPNFHHKTVASNNSYIVSAQMHSPPPPPPYKTAGLQKKTRIHSKGKRHPDSIANPSSAAAMV